MTETHLEWAVEIPGRGYADWLGGIQSAINIENGTVLRTPEDALARCKAICATLNKLNLPEYANAARIVTRKCTTTKTNWSVDDTWGPSVAMQKFAQKATKTPYPHAFIDYQAGEIASSECEDTNE